VLRDGEFLKSNRSSSEFAYWSRFVRCRVTPLMVRNRRSTSADIEAWSPMACETSTMAVIVVRSHADGASHRYGLSLVSEHAQAPSGSELAIRGPRKTNAAHDQGGDILAAERLRHHFADLRAEADTRRKTLNLDQDLLEACLFEGMVSRSPLMLVGESDSVSSLGLLKPQYLRLARGGCQRLPCFSISFVAVPFL
jgi:hypothetical protein